MTIEDAEKLKLMNPVEYRRMQFYGGLMVLIILLVLVITLMVIL